ncbi:hypothetical protein ACWCP6_24375 [Streptomyces sp. NPDC002004]
MNGAGAGRTERPREVGTAFALLLGAMTAEAITWVLGALVIPPTGFDDMRSAVGQHDAVVQLCVSAGAVLTITAAGLFVAAKMRAGRNWARVVLAVVSAGSLLMQLNDWSMGGFPWEWEAVLSTVPGLLAVAAAALMYLPESGAYFARPARPV